MDANGRIRLSPRFVNDFLTRCGGEIVLHGLPEKAIAVYPEEVFREIRKKELSSLDALGGSFVSRQSFRRFGALSQPDVISRQGRVTLPEALREYAMLEPGREVYVIGVEIGVEIWSPEAYRKEMTAIDAHLDEKREQQMLADLNRPSLENRS